MAFLVEPEDIVEQFANVVCPYRTNYLDDYSIKSYLEFSFSNYKEHHKEFLCFCYNCRIFKLLSEVVVSRVSLQTPLIKTSFKILFVRQAKKETIPISKEALRKKLRRKALKINRERLVKHLAELKARNFIILNKK